MSVKVVETTVNPVVVQSATAFNAAHAQIWAEGTDPQVEKLGGVHSAKGWAEVASHLATPEWGDIEGDIENQTDLMQALNGKQDIISDLSDIRSGAALGATAVQPGDLATVATTGAYNDLTGKPGVMTGADGENPGTSGFVPAPAATDNEKFLRGDGTWAEAGSQGGGAWGTITGTLSDQTDLQNALNAKADNFTIGEGLEWQAGRVLTAPDHLPPNVFTKDNVTAGTDIEINQILDPYVLNDDTLACFHLDGDTTNAVSTGFTLSDDFKAHITGYTDPLVNPWYPGRSAAIFEQGNQMQYDKLFQDNFTTFGTLGDYTLEFFVCPPGYNPSYSFYATDPSLSQTGTYPSVKLDYTGTPRYTFTCYSASGVSQQTTFNTSVYKHVAMVRKNQVCYVFIDGVLQTQSANSLNLGNFFFKSNYQPATIYIAEIVFSKIAKWDGNFTPPSAPYHQQEGGNQYEIKSTVIEKHATNCVTEIPRRVNLELSSGTMTLKAGSKVYVPNGSSTFDETTIANDITATESNDNNYLCFTNGTTINKRLITACFSGSAAPTLTGVTYAAWYDTANNAVKLTSDGGSTWATGYSFPFCSITVTSSAISSIDAVFNGFGYIGSTIFVLPGIKGLIPDGKNVDDTLKSIEYTQESVYTNTLTGTQSYVLHMGDGGAHESTSYVQQVTAPSANYTLWYSPSENKMRRKSGSGTIVTNNDFVYGFCETVNGVITSYNPYTVMRILDYNDKQIIAGWGAPSNKYVSLTPTNNATYTAPADGWFVFYGITLSTNNDAYIYHAGNSENRMNSIRVFATTVYGNDKIIGVSYPAKSGEVVGLAFTNVKFTDVDYSNLGLRFFYLEGNKPEGN